MCTAVPVRLVRLLLVAGLAVPAVARGEMPVSAADINPSRSGGSYVHRFFESFGEKAIAFGGYVYAQADDGIHGNELWRTDGTVVGTTLVGDLCPGACASGPTDFVPFGGHFYFRADDGVHGEEVWRSDGTPAGTSLLADLVPGFESSRPSDLTAFPGGLIFVARQGGMARLWRSDGTPAGTGPVFAPGTEPALSGLSVVAGTSSVVFFTATDADHGHELWATDGTGAGTHVLETAPGPADGPDLYRGSRFAYALAGERLVFVSGHELWQSDGSVAGTSPLPTPPYDPLNPNLRLAGSAGGRAFAVVWDELWATDGTVAGTTTVKSLAEGEAVSGFSTATVGGDLFFVLTAGNGATWQIWRSDGSAAGTSAAIDLAGGPYWPASLAAFGSDDLLVFLHDAATGVEPWLSDGTTAGTALLADVAVGTASSFDQIWHLQTRVHDVLPLGTSAVLRLFDADGDLELWRLDSGGAERLPINDATSSLLVGLTQDLSRRPLGTIGETLVLRADDGVHGTEPWRTDGSPAGTALLADLEPGTTGSWPAEVTPLAGNLLFIADGSLWRTQGVPGDAQSLATSVNQLTAAGPLAFFAGAGGTSWDLLWRSDGTPAGTAPVEGDHGIWCCRSGWEELDSRLVFPRADAVTTLWLSDGTGAGTVPLPGSPEVDFPFSMAVAGDRLFFAGVDGAGQELWVSDGVSAAERVFDVAPGAADGIARWQWDFVHAPPQRLAPLDAGVVFLADDGTSGEEPWFSDGTAEGTVQLADVFEGSRSAGAADLTSTGSRVFFVADDGVHGREPWVTDGTPEGTRLLLDVVPGPGSSVPRDLAAVGPYLLFTAWDATHGAEPWVSDGTPEGTFRLGDIAPGPLSSSPAHFTATPSRVYFVANDNTTGFEPWMLARTALASTPAHLYTVTPCRLYDSRQTTAVGPTPRRIPVAGSCGVPATARSIAANVTVTGATSGGHLAMGAALSPAPAAELLPFAAGLTRAQQTLLRLGFGELEVAGALAVPGGSVHVIVDVTGYFE